MEGIETVSSEVSCFEDEQTACDDTELCHKYLTDLQKYQQDEFTSSRNRTFQRENVLRVMNNNQAKIDYM